jgi:hypothetical protein
MPVTRNDANALDGEISEFLFGRSTSGYVGIGQLGFNRPELASRVLYYAKRRVVDSLYSPRYFLKRRLQLNRKSRIVDNH